MKKGSLVITIITFFAVIGLVACLFMFPTVLGIKKAQATGTPFLVTDKLGTNAFLTNSGDDIVYDKLENGVTKVYSYNVSSTNSTQLSGSTSNTYFSGDNTPYVNDSYAFYYDLRNSNDTDDTDADIYGVTLSNPTETRITSSVADRDVISQTDNYIAYAEYGTANPGIYLKNMANNNAPTRIHTFTRSQCINVCAGKYNGYHYIVFEDQNSAADIKMYRIETSTTTTIASTGNIEVYPIIQGQYIVYTSYSKSDIDSEAPKKSLIPYNENGGSLKLYNIASSTSTTIETFNSYDQLKAVQNGQNESYIIYEKKTGDGENSYTKAYKPSNSSTTTIASVTNNNWKHLFVVNGCLSGTKVVYAKEVTVNLDDPVLMNIYSYDLTSDATTLLCEGDEGYLLTKPKILGDTVIWQSGDISGEEASDGSLYGLEL